MAHYSYLSQHRQSVLVVEMTDVHAFTDRCRLVPFDGSSSGRLVGPQGLYHRCLGSSRTMDVIQRRRWRQFAHLAAEVPGRSAGADYLRPDREEALRWPTMAGRS